MATMLVHMEHKDNLPKTMAAAEHVHQFMVTSMAQMGCVMLAMAYAEICGDLLLRLCM